MHLSSRVTCLPLVLAFFYSAVNKSRPTQRILPPPLVAPSFVLFLRVLPKRHMLGFYFCVSLVFLLIIVQCDSFSPRFSSFFFLLQNTSGGRYVHFEIFTGFNVHHNSRVIFFPLTLFFFYSDVLKSSSVTLCFVLHPHRIPFIYPFICTICLSGT